MNNNLYQVQHVINMPVKLGKEKFEKFSDASTAIQKKKAISKERADAYVATVERKQGIEPRTGEKITKKKSKPTTRKANK